MAGCRDWNAYYSQRLNEIKLNFLILSYHLPIDQQLITTSADKITKSANQLLTKFGNISITGYFDVITDSKECNNLKHLSDFCHTFDLINIANNMLKPVTIVTELSDYHEMLTTTHRKFYTRQPLRDVFLIYGNFNFQQFLINLEINLLPENQSSDSASYN